jgi:SulP family sulfate permease
LNSVSSSFRPPSHFAIVISGLITGVLQVVLSTSYAALVYGGDLNRYVSQGIGFALVGALIIATITAVFAALPGTVGSNQDVSVAIFSIISASIIATMPYGASLESTFYTVVFAISITVSLAGLFFWGLGVFRLGGLVRYFPYPVIGGFLAGTGWLLFIGGFSLTLEIETWRELLQPHLLLRWLPSLLFALAILSATRRYHNNVIISVMILGGICVFYGVAWQLGYPIGNR